MAGSTSAPSPSPTSQPPRTPRSIAVLVTLFGLSALLAYPIYVPYQNPDQDVPMLLALTDLVRGGWAPTMVHYPTALMNLIRAACTLVLAIASASGHPLDALDLVATWDAHRPLFRVGLRVFAMAAGVVTLAVTYRIAALSAG